ncbi:MAG: ATP-binding protein, partial [Kiritimatiellia bacterium]|nr:ATP-binding protein [Kiritimatiellia bacterium]
IGSGMKNRAECVLYTGDMELATRWGRLLSSTCPLRVAETPARLETAVGGLGGAVVLLDLRAPEALDCLADMSSRDLPVVTIAICARQSDPAREAENRGVFGLLSPQDDWRRVAHMVVRALERADLELELRALRGAARENSDRSERPTASPRLPQRLSFDPFSAALRDLHDVGHLFQHVVEGVAQSAGVARVGLFAGGFDSPEEFRLRADRNCLADATHARFPADHPLAQWLERNAHVVSRNALPHIGAPADRPILARVLDQLGAEALVPLFANGRLIGWFFVGHRADGIPFTGDDLQDLASLAGPVSAAIANALLYDELKVQKKFADTLLQGLPVGIVAVDAGGFVRTVNRAGEQLLNCSAADLLGEPVDRIGGVAADLLLRGLKSSATPDTVEWDLPGGRRRLFGSVFPLATDAHPSGALLLIEDLSEKKRLAERAEQLDRSAFWTDLASAMAHEIRNPLVAVQTFAQLLPERYQDEAFRNEFSRTVPAEVARLAAIADQIGELAQPRNPEFKPLDIPGILTAAVEVARTRVANAPAAIEARMLDSVPVTRGDKASIVDALAHLIANALESIPDHRAGQVRVTATRLIESRGPMVSFVVEDNGRGIPEELRDKLFSPFSTTKARGMGLGLPIARRVALDHNGDIRIESLREGTRATLLLPTDPSVTASPA